MPEYTKSENEFKALLHQAGHRPAKGGKHWICAKCPDRKVPALSVDVDRCIFWCHRCLRGGGIGTLKKELGITETWTKSERRQFAIRKERARQEAQEFLAKLNTFRMEKIQGFGCAHFIHLLSEDLFKAATAKDEPVPEFVIDLAYLSAIDMDELSAELDVIEDPDQLKVFAELYRRRAA